MAVVIDGKTTAKYVYEHFLKPRIARLKEFDVVPGLAIISFGETSGQVYVKNKIKTCEKLGIYCEHHEFDFTDGTDIQEDVEALIDRLNECSSIHGIIVQLPIPDEFYIDAGDIIERIDPAKDVDGLTTYNVGRLWTHHDGYPYHYPCTPKGIVYLLKNSNVPLEGKNVVVIGRSDLVGKPLAAMMLEENATVEIWHSHTNPGNRDHMIQHADIIVCATGKPNMLDRYDCQNKVVIDVGINRVDGKLCGDIPEQAKKKAIAYTPVPGGVGPMTVAMLMDNVVRAAENEWILKAVI